MNRLSMARVSRTASFLALLAAVALSGCATTAADGPGTAAPASAERPVLAGRTSTDTAMPKTEAAAPVAGVEARLARLRELGREDKYREIIEQFKDEDISAWRPAFGADKHRADDMTGVGYDTRGRAYAGLGNLVAAERDLKLAVEISPPNGYFWNDLAQVYRELGKVDAAAGAYVKAVEMDRVDMGKKVYGWMALGATINGARLFAEQMKYDEALKLLALWDDEDIQKMGRGQGAGILRMYGEIYAGMGREEESLAKYKAALELERK